MAEQQLRQSKLTGHSEVASATEEAMDAQSPSGDELSQTLADLRVDPAVSPIRKSPSPDGSEDSGVPQGLAYTQVAVDPSETTARPSRICSLSISPNLQKTVARKLSMGSGSDSDTSRPRTRGGKGATRDRSKSADTKASTKAIKHSGVGKKPPGKDEPKKPALKKESTVSTKKPGSKAATAAASKDPKTVDPKAPATKAPKGQKKADPKPGAKDQPGKGPTSDSTKTVKTPGPSKSNLPIPAKGKGSGKAVVTTAAPTSAVDVLSFSRGLDNSSAVAATAAAMASTKGHGGARPKTVVPPEAPRTEEAMDTSSAAHTVQVVQDVLSGITFNLPTPLEPRKEVPVRVELPPPKEVPVRVDTPPQSTEPALEPSNTMDISEEAGKLDQAAGGGPTGSGVQILAPHQHDAWEKEDADVPSLLRGAIIDQMSATEVRSFDLIQMRTFRGLDSLSAKFPAWFPDRLTAAMDDLSKKVSYSSLSC